jgi:hypothetical protein
MVTLSRVTIYGNPRFPSMVNLDRVTIYGNPIYFPNKTGPGFIGLFHRGGLKLPSFFFHFFLFGVLMGFTWGIN